MVKLSKVLDGLFQSIGPSPQNTELLLLHFKGVLKACLGTHGVGHVRKFSALFWKVVGIGVLSEEIDGPR